MESTIWVGCWIILYFYVILVSVLFSNLSKCFCSSKYLLKLQVDAVFSLPHPDFLTLLVLCWTCQDLPVLHHLWSSFVLSPVSASAVSWPSEDSSTQISVTSLPPTTRCLPLFKSPKQFAKELLLDVNLLQAHRTSCHGFKFNKKPSSLGLKMTSSFPQCSSCLASRWLPVAHTCVLQLCVLLKHTLSTAESPTPGRHKVFTIRNKNKTPSIKILVGDL